MVQHTRVADRLSAAADKSTKKSRSDELQKCKEKFDTFKEQFQPFIATLKTYHTAIVNLEHCRSEMLQQIEVFTKSTKLYDHAGKGNQVIIAAPTWAKTYSKKDHSYCSMERQMSALNNKYATNIEQYCVDYVNEWEIVVTTRVEAAVSKAEELKKTWQHYDKKYQGLSENEAKVTDRGKELRQSDKDKLKRNEEKLDVAKQEFDKAATTACHLIDSAVDCAWMDMTPIVFRLTNMELDRLGGKDSAALTKSLTDLVTKLKEFAQEHKLNLTAPDVKAKKAPTKALIDPPKAKRTKSKSPTPTKKKPTAPAKKTTTTPAKKPTTTLTKTKSK